MSKLEELIIVALVIICAALGYALGAQSVKLDLKAQLIKDCEAMPWNNPSPPRPSCSAMADLRMEQIFSR